WRGRVGLSAVVLVGLTSIAIVLLPPVLLSRDVYSYAAYGRISALHGGNPYVTAPSALPGDPFTPVISPAWRNTRSVYGPAFSLLMWLWWLWREAPAPNRARTAAGHVGLAAILAVALSVPFFAGWRTVTALANLASRQGWASGARLVARGAQALGRAVGGEGAA